MKNTVKKFAKYSFVFMYMVMVVLAIMALVFLIVTYSVSVESRGNYEQHAVYHRQGILQTDDGNFWEVDYDLIPASEYTVIFNNNGTPQDTSDDYIEHLTQYQKIF